MCGPRLPIPIGILAFALAALLPAHAQEWPTKPVRIIVPYSAGSPPDITTRIVTSRLGERLGQSFVVENKPGAMGTLGLSELDRQPADGYTAMTLLTPVVVSPALLPDQPRDFGSDYVPVGQYDWTYSVLVVNPQLPVDDVNDLIGLLREKPNAYSFASGGHGTPAHLSGELFNLQNGVKALHVPYNQFPMAIADLAAGRVDFMFLTSTVAAPQVESGRLKALAIASSQSRLPGLPDVPTMHELGFDTFDVRNWDGFIMKAGTPPAVVARFNAALNAVLADPDTVATLRATGSDPVAGRTPDEFRERIRFDQKRLSDLIEQAGVKLE
ncbi:MAG: tripartite tricarboxylate transporter substrate binding protein [Pigmentiphaga sp.]|nr:tripartite tricarboxylate transporter substrate binding protein [Pigmentiphaga sp.]